MSGERPFRRAAILGVGLMGGSLGMALRVHRLAAVVAGWDPNGSSMTNARRIGALDACEEDAVSAVRDADLVVLASPVGSLVRLLESVAPAISPDALVTDLGSVKAPIVGSGEALLGARFIGGHPMAGSEKSGVHHARPDLFLNAAWAIVRSTVPDAADPRVARLNSLVASLGSRPVLLDAVRHDRLAALVSHLPHAISFAYADAVRADAERDLALNLAGGSYRDLTRISESDPGLWDDIFRENREALKVALAAFRQRLDALEQRLDRAPELLSGDSAGAPAEG